MGKVSQPDLQTWKVDSWEDRNPRTSGTSVGIEPRTLELLGRSMVERWTGILYTLGSNPVRRDLNPRPFDPYTSVLPQSYQP
ncbi:hypothetical protein OUZ56_030665 [Daphnia magna]|uniref:Uncharacterized protein n=1 Tax=Daphnia magna TaxID=35525 RepID=A0ABQ9ZRZ2_9CRUS|nr:hypothetical protein OUZ56_030665 [Daphnia magna]